MSYTLQDFYSACNELIGEEEVSIIRTIPTATVPYLCETVARKAFLNELKSNCPMALDVVRTTAENLWRKSGCSELKKENNNV